jgi:nucleoside-diphosphate-sugar epimerase
VDFQLAGVCNFDEIALLIRGAAVVFHEAAIPSVPRSIADPVPSHDININGTFNVLRAAHEGKAGRVVYAASSSAYGDTEVLPKVESMPPSPKSPYALQKLVGEQYCQLFTSVYGLDTVAIRYFNVYGPRQDPSSPYSPSSRETSPSPKMVGARRSRIDRMNNESTLSAVRKSD